MGRESGDKPVKLGRKLAQIRRISDDENPELVRSLYNQIYQLAEAQGGQRLQFLLIDSDLVEPEQELAGFSERRMAGEPDAPSLIPYYVGP